MKAFTEKEQELLQREDVKKVIYIKGLYDCKGGVQEVVVTRDIYTLDSLDNRVKTILFEGDIKDLSTNDDTDEIDSKIQDMFKIDGFKVKNSLQ